MKIISQTLFVKLLLSSSTIFIVGQVTDQENFSHCIEGSSEECHDDRKEFNECGSACPPTCTKPDPLFCTRECVARCFCLDEYFEGPNGSCYSFDECKIVQPTINNLPKEIINYSNLLRSHLSYLPYTFNWLNQENYTNTNN